MRSTTHTVVEREGGVSGATQKQKGMGGTFVYGSRLPHMRGAGSASTSTTCRPPISSSSAHPSRAVSSRAVGKLNDAGVFEDEFTHLGDRRNAPTLPLPPLRGQRRVVLVRHGQSTWNAIARMQGSSNISELTEKGKSQAATAHLLLEDECFDLSFSSPLKRCLQTYQVVWGERGGAVRTLPVLREIDLYSFQGLDKSEAAKQFPSEYRLWKDDPANFQIDGHYPVRELWHRGSLGWYDMLQPEVAGPLNILVVAHNAINQALIASAIGLEVHHFRRLVQSNAASTVLSFSPGEHASSQPLVSLEGLNETPESPLDPTPGAKVILVCHGVTDSEEAGMAPGFHYNEACNAVGREQALHLGRILQDLRVESIMCSPMRRARDTAEVIANVLGEKEVMVNDLLHDRKLGFQDDMPMPFGEEFSQAGEEVTGAEPMEEVWKRAGQAWASVLQSVGDNGTVVLVGHGIVNSAMICRSLSLSPDYVNRIRLSPGSVSIVKFPDGALGGPGIIETLNYTKHLSPSWAVPIYEPRDVVGQSSQMDGF